MVKIGIVGARGVYVAGAISAMPDRAKVTAVCDIDEEVLKRSCERVLELGANTELPKAYRVYEDMLSSADIDAVVISTPMQCHVPQAMLALEAGKHVMCEVTAGVTMDELFWLVDAVESSGRIFMYAENYCYMPEVQLVRELVKRGMLGDIYYGEGEYTHDCTGLCFHDGRKTWRHYWQMGTRGAFYPTHSLGPVMQCFDDDRIVSIASFSCGNHNPYGLRNDDVTQTLCQLASGKLVKVRVDTVSPRPHLMNYYQIQGTKGCFEMPRLGGEAKIAIATEEDPRGFEHWRPLSDFNEYLPERYRRNEGINAGHGGGDYYIVWDFIDAVEKNVMPELNVYKAAEWTAVALLSQLSVTNNGRVMEMPDFRANMPWEEKRIKL